MSAPGGDLSARGAEIVEDFGALPAADRLQLLVEIGQELPEPPAYYAEHPELLERVRECQSPVYVRAEVTGGGDGSAGDDAVVRLHVLAPAQAPTTRGFAGVLHEVLDGAPVAEVLALPADFHTRLGLGGAVSPLRLNAMAAMLGRIQRQVAAATS